jgi:4-hydroxybenzoate polyprenyltransferase
MNGIKTLPNLLGRNKIKNLLLFMNTIFIFWLIFSYFLGFFHRYLFVLIFTIAYGYWYILHFCKEGKKIGKSLDLLVDGEFIGIAIAASFTFI